MALSVSDFRERFDEFTEALYSESLVEGFITDAERIAGRLSPEAMKYCTAHLLTLFKEQTQNEDGEPVPDGGSGVVVSETIGPRAVAYATPDGRKFYERTYYGRMFLELQRATPRRNMPMVLG